MGSSVSKVGGDVAISENTVPEIDFTYFVTDHVGLELIAGTTYHDVQDKNSAAGTVPLGSVRLLPPTLTAQWHFAPRSMVDPYVGAGVNYTFFYGAKYSGPVIQSIHYSDAVGAALQAGADLRISDRFYLNADVKKLFLGTDVKLGTAVGPISAKVNIDPWLIGFGFGYRL